MKVEWTVTNPTPLPRAEKLPTGEALDAAIEESLSATEELKRLEALKIQAANLEKLQREKQQQQQISQNQAIFYQVMAEAGANFEALQPRCAHVRELWQAMSDAMDKFIAEAEQVDGELCSQVNKLYLALGDSGARIDEFVTRAGGKDEKLRLVPSDLPHRSLKWELAQKITFYPKTHWFRIFRHR